MEPIEFPSEFSEFLKLLNANAVEYLLVGGFAVAIHGYPRATANIDVWVARDLANADRIVTALSEFGFDVPALTSALFTEPDKIVRMGTAPMQIELLTTIDGVEFRECAKRAITYLIDDSPIPVIGLEDLKANKRACGRNKDLDDLDNLP
jgi:phage replication-related protein YjqB (UPF0714/DUF867 family)